MSPAPDTTAAAATPGARALSWVRRQPKRHLLLVALVPVLLLLWLPILTGGTTPAAVAAKTTPPVAGTAPVAAAPAGESAPGSLATTTIAAAAALEQRVRTLTAPFQPRWIATTPAPVTAPPRAAADPISYSALVPSAILLSRGGDPVAIVQGRACRVGDVVAGRTIVAIEERRVVYREGGRTVTADMTGTALGGN